MKQNKADGMLLLEVAALLERVSVGAVMDRGVSNGKGSLTTCCWIMPEWSLEVVLIGPLSPAARSRHPGFFPSVSTTLSALATLLLAAHQPNTSGVRLARARSLGAVAHLFC